MNKFTCNSFQVPNVIVDKLMSKISGNALKCYMIITRKTIGWGKSIDKISISQFMNLSGIKDKRTVYASLNELLNIGLVRSDKNNGVITKFSVVDWPEESVEKNVTSNKRCAELVTKNVAAASGKKCHLTKNMTKTIITNEKIGKKEEKLDLSLFYQKPHEKVWADYLEYRKNKKAKLTQTALNQLIEEINKANRLDYSTNSILAECMLRNWYGFKLEWIVKDRRRIDVEKINHVSNNSSNPSGFKVING